MSYVSPLNKIVNQTSNILLDLLLLLLLYDIRLQLLCY